MLLLLLPPLRVNLYFRSDGDCLITQCERHPTRHDQVPSRQRQLIGGRQPVQSGRSTVWAAAAGGGGRRRVAA